MKDYEITPEQKKTLVALKRAFTKCQKAGLVFLGKESQIMAYQTRAYKHSVPLHEHWNYGEMIPCKGISGCIIDSGADDMEYFPKGFIK